MQDTNENKVTIYFIRHAMTLGNEMKRYIGVTDEKISEAGRKDIESNEYPTVAMVFTSPMTRCMQTASLIYQQKEIVIDEFREMNFGSFEGKNYMELDGDAAYQQWLDSNCENKIEGGQSRQEFICQTMKGFWKMIDIIMSENVLPDRVAAVVHGGTIMAIFHELGICDYYEAHLKNGEYFGLVMTVNNSGQGHKLSFEKVRM